MTTFSSHNPVSSTYTSVWAVSVTAREMLLARQDEYKSAAMQAKTAGDLKTATKYLAVSKVTHTYPW